MTVITHHRLEGAEYVASPNHSGEITPKFIVQHYTAGYSAESAIAALTRKGSGVSAHVTVALDGTITQHVPFNIRAWHAGPSTWMGYTGLNGHSIGIEIVNIGWLRVLGDGNYQDSYGNNRTANDFPHGIIHQANSKVGSGTFGWPCYTPEQLQAVEDLTEALCNTYGIIDIVSHEQIDNRGWKTDPGPAFPMKRMTQHLTTNRGDDSEQWEVTASSLKVRSGPSTKFKTLGALKKGTQVEILTINGSWGRIDDDGWVHTGYLRRA
jgi:N-acetylmuramoyl-L-alanine amidase